MYGKLSPANQQIIHKSLDLAALLPIQLARGLESEASGLGDWDGLEDNTLTSDQAAFITLSQPSTLPNHFQ